MSTLTAARPAPPTVRDPFIDVLRVGAILVVVLGHWIMPVFAFDHGRLVAGNVLATPGWWLMTWFAQVMPVFFVAGGAANCLSYTAALRRGRTTRDWLAVRVRRLVTPAVPLLAVWLVVPSVLRDLGVPGQAVGLAAGVVGQLLWFLAVYLVTVAATPVMVVAARRWGLAVPAVLGAAAFGVDMLRFHGVPLVGYLNEVLVWLAVQQWGIAYATGRFDRLTRRGAVVLGVAGIIATVLLVRCGPYPVSMVGIPGQAASNMAPATVCLLTLGVGQLGFLLALRDRLVRSAHRVLFALGSRCMTIYLWHMTAMVAVAGIAVLGFGYVTPAPGSAAWFAVTPLWIVALAVVLAGLVRVFGRFETVRGGAAGRPLMSAVLAGTGLLGIAAFGFGTPLLALPFALAVVAALALVRPGALAGHVTTAVGRLMDAIFRA